MQGNEQFMRLAIELATENVVSGQGGPFGAVVVKDGTVIATGANNVTASHDPTAHAEITALRNAARVLGTFELKGCTIYSSCEPCPMCLGAIYWAHCDALFFGSTAEDAATAGFDDAFIYSELRKSIGERSLRSVNLMRDEAAQSFKAWREFEARVAY